MSSIYNKILKLSFRRLVSITDKRECEADPKNNDDDEFNFFLL